MLLGSVTPPATSRRVVFRLPLFTASVTGPVASALVASASMRWLVTGVPAPSVPAGCSGRRERAAAGARRPQRAGPGDINTARLGDAAGRERAVGDVDGCHVHRADGDRSRPRLREDARAGDVLRVVVIRAGVEVQRRPARER